MSGGQREGGEGENEKRRVHDAEVPGRVRDGVAKWIYERMLIRDDAKIGWNKGRGNHKRKKC